MLRAISALLLALILTAPAIARETGFPALIIDPDKNGTNLRDAPKGKVIKVIPKGESDAELEMRQVILLENRNGWFRVKLNDGTQGWMHHSVLGACASGTEDGAKLYLENGLAQAENTIWAKVSYYKSDKKRTAWARPEVINPNPHNNCHEK